MSDHEAVIIEVAINGATKPERNPNVPLSPDAIRDDALRCLDGGASVIHAHNHDITLQGDTSSDPFGGEWGMSARSKGVTFGLPPTKHALLAYLDMIGDTGIPWSVSVWGGDLLQTPVALLALEMGGHLHIGLEEHFDPARKPTNVELLDEAVALCTSVGRPVATCAQAAALLGLP